MPNLQVTSTFSIKYCQINAETYFLQQSLKYANFHSHVRGDCVIIIGRGVILELQNVTSM